ncbi:MAG: exonuclease domain-containing protein [Candidatus Peregrinibacteria bacterium]|nr:exonuclease domain-containing protein [Candidatus Peregrinibacteria bacterium]
MFVSLDLETTGFDPNIDKIIEFGAVKFDLTGEKETLKFFVNPGVTLPKIITHITNIKDSDLKDAPPFEDKRAEVQAFIGNLPIIGHNIKFDLAFLEANKIEIKNPSYDTQELSGILLPNMPSYSLEILSEKLNLTHCEKHRALDDSIAAMELFLKLIKEFENLEPELLEQMKALTQKSNWPLKNLISSISSKPNPEAKVTKKEPKEFTPSANSLKILEHTESALFELIPPYDNLIKTLCEKADGDTCIVVPYQTFRKINSEISHEVSKVDVAKSYVSLKRLKRFSEKEFFENYEISALLKYLNWSKQTKTGLLSEVALFHDERATILKVNIDENITNPEEEMFFKKALEKGQNKASLYTNQALIENPPENKRLILIDFDNFLNSLHFHASTYIKLEPAIDILKTLEEYFPSDLTVTTLITKTTILFGLLGIIFERHNDQSIYGAKSTINTDIFQTKEWIDAVNSLNNVIEISQELVNVKNEETAGSLKQWKTFLKNLYSILSKPDLANNMVWLEKDPQSNIVIRKAPFSLKEDLKNIFGKAKNYQIIDECVTINDDGNFIKSLGNLDSKLPIYDLNPKDEKIEIYITKDTDGSDLNKIPRFIEKYYKEKSQNIVMLFSAKKDLEVTTLQLSKENVPVLPQLAGSLGKIQERYISEKKSLMPPVLLVTSHIWENFEPNQDIDTLIIYKIPFDPPSDPKIISLSRNYANAFMELQVPLAVKSTKKIINRLKSSHANLKKVIIFDIRLTNKKYADVFLENLNLMAPTSVVKLHTLL